MQIKVKDFIEKIENQAYRHETILLGLVFCV